jgi:hypothetical protein
MLLDGLDRFTGQQPGVEGCLLEPLIPSYVSIFSPKSEVRVTFKTLTKTR